MQKGSINRVILVGYLGGDPESRYTPSGTAVANFNVATNESRKNSDGGFEDHTEWHRCVLFGKPAETATQYLKKGQMVYGGQIENALLGRQGREQAQHHGSAR